MRSATLGACLAAITLTLSPAKAGVVADHGRLQTKGNQIVDKNGEPFQVAGMSLYWSVWGGQNYYNRSVIDTINSSWNATVVRAAAAVFINQATDKGFIWDSAGLVAKVKTVVDAAIANDIYVIIDWHADTGVNKAWQRSANFFSLMAQTYGDKPNVIFELWNEPTTVKWDTVKNYALRVLPSIRQYSQNLVVVGTPTWSQDVDLASQNPITDTNVAYTLHFYACSHGHNLIKKANTARTNGVPLFITEFGLSPSDGGSVSKGNYKICTDSATFWLDWADSNKISWANWSLSNKGESSAALDSTNKNYAGNWPDNTLSASGKWIKARLLARGSQASGILPAGVHDKRWSVIRTSGSEVRIQLPTGTSQASLLDIQGRGIVHSADEVLTAGNLRRGVHTVRWKDAVGWHSGSFVLP